MCLCYVMRCRAGDKKGGVAERKSQLRNTIYIREGSRISHKLYGLALMHGEAHLLRKKKEKKRRDQAVKIDHKSHKTSKDIYLFPFR